MRPQEKWKMDLLAPQQPSDFPFFMLRFGTFFESILLPQNSVFKEAL